LKLTEVSEVRTASIIKTIIALMTETVRISETSVNFNMTTLRYVPKYSKLLSFFVLSPMPFTIFFLPRHYSLEWALDSLNLLH
jgi:hypothetical protein